MTRFAKISPPWQSFKSLWQYFKGLFIIWQKLEHTLANFFAIGLLFKWQKIEQITKTSGQTGREKERKGFKC